MSDRASSQQDSGLAGQVWSDFHPVVFDGFEGLDTKANRALLKSLELALVPSKAKPGRARKASA